MAVTVIHVILLLAAPPNEPSGLFYNMSYEQQTEMGAAQSRQKRRLAAILHVCQTARKAKSPASALAHYADANGLSSLGRLELTMDCQIYEQGRRDGAAARASEK
ncbi:MAG: hypothetical protein PGN09_13035 [Sphingomonas fennica]